MITVWNTDWFFKLLQNTTNSDETCFVGWIKYCWTGPRELNWRLQSFQFRLLRRFCLVSWFNDEFSPKRKPRRWERLCCLTSTKASRPIRDGDEWKRGTEEWNLETGANPENLGCRGPPPEQQNVKAVSVRHCAATTAPRNCCPNCYAEQSHKDNVRSSAVGKQLKQKKIQLFL